MDIPEGFSANPYETTWIFGAKLAGGHMTGDETIRSLSEMLMDVRCDPATVKDDVDLLEQEVGKEKISRLSPLFRPIAHVATRGILLRNNDEDLPAENSVSLQDALDNTTEGIFREIKSDKEYRGRVTTEIATHLRCLISGFENGGMSKTAAKKVVLEEFELGLDDVATRLTSYAAMNHLLVSSTIMSIAGLYSPSVIYRGVKRVAVNLRRK